MATLAMIAVITREHEGHQVRARLHEMADGFNELILVDDGVGASLDPLIKDLTECYACLRVVRYRKPAFYLGSWKPLVDELTSELVTFLSPCLILRPDYYRRTLAAFEQHPACRLAFGGITNGVYSDEVSQFAESDVHRINRENFIDMILATTGAQGSTPATAVFRRADFIESGGFRWELAGGHGWPPFLIIGLGDGAIYLGDECGIRLGEDWFPAVYGETRPLRVLDDLARMHHVVNGYHATDAVGKWHQRMKDAYIHHVCEQIHAPAIRVNKTMDALYGPGGPRRGLLVAMAQRMVGLCRRILAGRMSVTLCGYKPDVECYGWIKPSFSFGVNWRNFIRSKYNEDRVVIAQQDLLDFLEVKNFSGMRVMDIGCGSGIHSLAALRAGADELVSFDYDSASVEATRRLFEDEGSPSRWTVSQGSVLDPEFMGRLAPADLVYSWGVLHHTGQMWEAVKAAAQRMKPDGLLFIALYTKWPGSDDAVRLKIRYNRAGWFRKRWMEMVLMRAGVPGISYLFKDPGFFLDRLKDKLTLIRTYRKFRGMSFYHDIVDWLGGYPYEDATVEEVVWFCKTFCALTPVKVRDRGGNLCSYYLFRKGKT